MIRVGTGELGDVRGRLLRTTIDTLFVSSAAAERGIPISRISGLWIERHSSKTGAKVGALVGGVGLGVLGAIACTAFDEGGDGDTAGRCFGPVAVIAIGGAGVGAFDWGSHRLLDLEVGEALPLRSAEE
jgi:hypothetical protein